jgi:hypothetical protein
MPDLQRLAESNCRNASEEEEGKVVPVLEYISITPWKCTEQWTYNPCG